METALSALRALVRVASSTVLGLLLLALVVLYLSAASVPPSAAAMAGLLHTAPQALYAHGLFLALVGLLGANLLLATGLRVRFDLPRLGAHAAHAGTLVLLAASVWYGTHRLAGQSISYRTADGWTPVRHAYLDDTLILTLRQGTERDVQVPLQPVPDDPSLLQGDPWGRGLLVHRQSSAFAPAMQLAVTDGNDVQTVVLSPDIAGRESLRGEDYVLLFRPHLSDEEARELFEGDASAFSFDAGVIVVGSQGQAAVVVIRPDGQREVHALQPGSPTEVVLGGRAVRITPLRFLRIPVFTAKQREPESRFLLPYDEFATPGLGALVTSEEGPASMGELILSRRRVELPGELRLLGTEYQTYPGSGIPRDYVTRVEVDRGGAVEREVIALNDPVRLGPFQLSHESWLPASDPQMVILSAATAPGLWAVWVGCALISLGLPWAFFVKPLLLRRGGPEPERSEA